MSDEAPQGRLQWEYRVESIKTPEIGTVTDALNRLGAEGWEVISIATTVKTWVNLTGNDLVFVLKRPGLGVFAERPEDRPGFVAY